MFDTESEYLTTTMKVPPSSILCRRSLSKTGDVKCYAEAHGVCNRVGQTSSWSRPASWCGQRAIHRSVSGTMDD